jgi:hypothetical protein
MMEHDQDIFSFPLDFRALQSTSTLKTFYRNAKPIVEISFKEALNFGPSFQRINDHFRLLIPVILFEIILYR